MTFLSSGKLPCLIPFSGTQFCHCFQSYDLQCYLKSKNTHWSTHVTKPIGWQQCSNHCEKHREVKVHKAVLASSLWRSGKKISICQLSCSVGLWREVGSRTCKSLLTLLISRENIYWILWEGEVTMHRKSLSESISKSNSFFPYTGLSEHYQTAPVHFIQTPSLRKLWKGIHN